LHRFASERFSRWPSVRFSPATSTTLSVCAALFGSATGLVKGLPSALAIGRAAQLFRPHGARSMLRLLMTYPSLRRRPTSYPLGRFRPDVLPNGVTGPMFSHQPLSPPSPWSGFPRVVAARCGLTLVLVQPASGRPWSCLNFTGAGTESSLQRSCEAACSTIRARSAGPCAQGLSLAGLRIRPLPTWIPPIQLSMRTARCCALPVLSPAQPQGLGSTGLGGACSVSPPDQRYRGEPRSAPA